jgi:hypothetical protein
VYAYFWSQNLKRRNHLDDPDVDGRAILKKILKKQGGGGGLDSSGIKYSDRFL